MLLVPWFVRVRADWTVFGRAKGIGDIGAVAGMLGGGVWGEGRGGANENHYIYFRGKGGGGQEKGK